MALFRKKPDPLSARARELNDRIAALEAQIQKISAEPPPETPAPPLKQSPSPAASSPAPVQASAPHPRLRSTALPHGPTITSAPPAASPAHQEPIFEELDQARLKKESEARPQAPDLPNDLAARRNGLFAFWTRLKQYFRGPATSNPKLVNYLAAGSIQGLRPLRYEKRVARNRFILLAGFIILFLWGLVALLLKHK